MNIRERSGLVGCKGQDVIIIDSRAEPHSCGPVTRRLIRPELGCAPATSPGAWTPREMVEAIQHPASRLRSARLVRRSCVAGTVLPPERPRARACHRVHFFDDV